MGTASGEKKTDSVVCEGEAILKENGRIEKEGENLNIINVISERGIISSFQLLGLYVKISVGNKEGRALVDTGASLSLINKSLAGKINESEKLFFNIAGGRKVSTLGFTEVDFFIGNKKYIQKFHVLENCVAGAECILGLDFISKHHVQILGGSKDKPVIEIEGDYVPTFYTLTPVVKSPVFDSYNVCTGRCKDRVEVKANCINYVNVKTDQKFPSGTDVLVTPCQKYEGLITPHVTTIVNDEFSVPFVNIFNVPHILEPQELVLIEKIEVVEHGTQGDGGVERGLGKEIVTVGVVEKETFDVSSVKRLKQICDVVLPQTDSQFHDILRKLIEKYPDVIAIGDEPPGRINSSPFRIQTEGGPIKSRPYKLPYCREEIVEKQVNDLLRDGTIKHSASPWSSPIVLAKKKDGTMRLCVDYRRLNAITTDDLFPLPAIEDLLAKIKKTRYFSTLDMKAGYHQIPVAEEDREKTAFIVGNGLYEYNFLPFGLKNAPAHFSRVMMSILAGLIGTSVLIYLDDIIILGDSLEEHLANLLKVLEAFRKHGIRLKIEKCSFFKEEVIFLGHKVTREGLKPCFDKVSAIRDFPTPKNVKDVASFLGLAGYYRKFIARFGEIARPLNFLKKGGDFQWGEEQDKAFKALKSILTGDEVLAFPNFSKPFFVTTDASNFALGGVISQFDDNNVERPICFASRSLHKAELNYSVFEKEALAVVWMLERHRYLLLGHEIYLRSDHRPLRDLFARDCKSSRQFRWIERILEFNVVNVDYVQGKNNVVADCLSRRREECAVLTRSKAKIFRGVPGNENSEPNGQLSEDVGPGGAGRSDCPVNEVRECGWDETELIDEQKATPWILHIRNFVAGKSSYFPPGIKVSQDNFCIENDILYVRDELSEMRVRYRAVLPRSLILRALHAVHSSPLAGHFGVERTLRRAKECFFWVGMHADVKRFIASCHKCMCFKTHRKREPEARKWPAAPHKFYRVHIDVLGPLPSSAMGHKYICVFVDSFSRFTYLHAMTDKTASSVALAIRNFISQFGSPRIFISDNGLEFVNKIVKELLELLNIEFFQVQFYRPSANGLVESHNKVIGQILRTMVDDDEKGWVYLLPLVQFAINTAYNRSIGESPWFIVFGQDPQLPYATMRKVNVDELISLDDFKRTFVTESLKISELVTKMLRKSNDLYKNEFDTRNRTKDLGFCVGDRVYVKKGQIRKSKLEAFYVGPFRITGLSHNVAELVSLQTGKEYKYHLSLLAKAEDPDRVRYDLSVNDPYPRGLSEEEEREMLSNEIPEVIDPVNDVMTMLVM